MHILVCYQWTPIIRYSHCFLFPVIIVNSSTTIFVNKYPCSHDISFGSIPRRKIARLKDLAIKERKRRKLINITKRPCKGLCQFPTLLSKEDTTLQSSKGSVSGLVNSVLSLTRLPLQVDCYHSLSDVIRFFISKLEAFCWNNFQIW